MRTLDDHKTVRRTLLEWIKSLDREAADTTISHWVVANCVVMLGGICMRDNICETEDDVLPEYTAWHRSHRATWSAAVIRLLKRHRRWAAVKRILLANGDPDYPVITPEFHQEYVTWLNSVR